MSSKTPAKDKLDPCLALHLRMANRVISQIYDRQLAACGIKVTQFSILRAVEALGETTNKTLQKALVLDQTTLSRNLKPLVRDGFIAGQAGQDRREKVLSLTDDGRALFRRASSEWQHAQDRVIDELGDEMTRKVMAVSKSIVKLKA